MAYHARWHGEPYMKRRALAQGGQSDQGSLKQTIHFLSAFLLYELSAEAVDA